MKHIAVIGASGYTGAQMACQIASTPGFALQGLYVSAESEDLGKCLNTLYPGYPQLNIELQGLTEAAQEQIARQADAVVLATDHRVSAALAAWFVAQQVPVFDLSGAYRFIDATAYPAWYGFTHPEAELLSAAVYGLVEWHAADIAKAKLIAVPGCYPTASLLALKPLVGMLDTSVRPVINAVSGVTGAGRKAQLHTSFSEVSLTPYGVLGHRHWPEIETQLGREVIFTPHLGNFKRGILATITVKLQPGVTRQDIANAFAVYDDCELVHMLPNGFPKIDDVAGTPLCLMGWQYHESSGYLVIGSAIDNLLKGAAGQAMQCIKIHFEQN
ncbi:N-acetyl-gamma-glutamyl-phosphate reductase [Shewanella sp. NFH-SH190041]|uniref:N-acetyl-gamma-glutamyl-phosphate reductase n=1 Tax=Shewanella sp. NFH-SH190041 TaxID=2950245 RepID=UPI0021C399CE|nr:N-acetyl-gamma-glutamyl-phosphate reductase [Shewanella sp. NFH-SH190041]BDM66119.1 N-acetyl-gamma-glutamyl-phosphate reductase [Shewanella sp. NFH-SH190041]